MSSVLVQHPEYTYARNSDCPTCGGTMRFYLSKNGCWAIGACRMDNSHLPHLYSKYREAVVWTDLGELPEEVRRALNNEGPLAAWDKVENTPEMQRVRDSALKIAERIKYENSRLLGDGI